MSNNYYSEEEGYAYADGYDAGFANGLYANDNNDDCDSAYSQGYNDGLKSALKDEFAIYNLRAYGGQYEDSYDDIIYSTTSEKEAEEKMKELKNMENERLRKHNLTEDDSIRFYISKLKVNAPFVYQRIDGEYDFYNSIEES